MSFGLSFGTSSEWTLEKVVDWVINRGRFGNLGNYCFQRQLYLPRVSHLPPVHNIQGTKTAIEANIGSEIVVLIDGDLGAVFPRQYHV